MAFWAIRSTSRRSASPDRIEAVVSSCSRSRRVTGMLLGRHGLVAVCPDEGPCTRAAPMEERDVVPSGVGGHSGRDRVTPAPGGSALARSCVLLALCFLALPLHRRLLVVLAAACFGEDATLLDLLVEAAECALERLVLTNSDFGQSRFTSSGRGLVPAS